MDFVTQLYRDIEMQARVARTVHRDATLAEGKPCHGASTQPR
jgi:hypothetical protein